MKLHPESIDIDLVVEPKRLTKKEMKEFGEFIEQVRRKKKQTKKKHARHKTAA